MNKVVFLVVLFLIGLVCFAEESGAYQEVDALLSGGLRKNYKQIARLSGDLEESEKLSLYDQYASPGWKKAVGPLVNAFGGFGIGSFVQGDTAGGIVCAVTETLGWGAMGAGYFVLLSELDKTEKDTTRVIVAGTGTYLGAAVFIFSRVFGTVRAAGYPAKQNRQLRRALDIDERLVMNIEPSIDITDRGIVLSLARFSF